MYNRYLGTALSSAFKVISQGHLLQLLTKGTLYKRFAEVDKRAENMFDQLVKSLAKEENITENLKANDMLLWVKKMNNLLMTPTFLFYDSLICFFNSL